MGGRSDLDLQRFAGRSWINMLFVGMLFLIFGIIMAVCRADSIDIVVGIGGILLLLFGAADFGSYRGITRAGTAAVVAGIVLLILSLYVEGAVILGAGVALAGLLMICGTKRFLGVRLDQGTVRRNRIGGIVLIAAGVILAADIADLADTLMLIIGIIMIVMGTLHIIAALSMTGRL